MTPVDVVQLRRAAAETCEHGEWVTRCLRCQVAIARRGPWTEASITALLDHLQRLTDAVEKLGDRMGVQEDHLGQLIQGLQRRGSL